MHPSSRQECKRLGRLGNGDHLGMGGGIVQLFPLVVRRGNNPLLAHDDRAYGHFIFAQCLFSLFQGQSHEMFVHGRVGDWRLEIRD